ncbi:MAG: sigma-54 interaction domain-containing protein, partial [Gammaproteobacteria bacterium]
ACRLLGLSKEEITNTKISSLFAPSFPALQVFSTQAIEKGSAWCDHLIIQCPNGDIRLEIQCRSIHDDEKNYLFMSIQSSDELELRRGNSNAEQHFKSGIGHWNHVQKVFQEFERRNQLILDAVGEGIYGVDANGMTTFINPQAEKLLGYEVEELAGRNMHSMIHYSHQDGSHFDALTCPIFSAFRDGKVHTVDNDVFWTKSGKPIHVEYTSTPIRENGFIAGAVIVFRDVTEKLNNQKRLISALNEVQELKNRLELENAYLQEEISEEYNHQKILGNSPAINLIIQQINLVAPTDTTVLVTGESGTGKELIARAIHDASNRSERSLIRVNCAAVPEDLFESEFFGHVRGSFTGASSDRLGRFELADGGTIFLDEVGEIPLNLQGKLLRVLQEQQFERVGDAKTRDVDVRIIAATNKNLKKQVELGKFREDLYFRLNVFPIESLPLRKRIEDIPILVQHFLQRFAKRINKNNLKISLSGIEKLKNYHWPGNIRELENIIERQVILSKTDSLQFDNLSISEDTAYKVSTKNKIFTELELKDMDRRNLILALKQCHGKVFGDDGVAKMLGIKPTTVASRIKKYSIDVRDFKLTTNV